MTKNGREPIGNTSNGKDQRLKGPGPNKTKMNKNMQRLGGRGLSLEAFANSKSGARNYNPAFIKKQREFYKDAKFVSKYKKTVKQHEQFNNSFVNTDPENDRDDANHEKKKRKKKQYLSAQELYEKTVEAEQKAKIERDAIRRAKEEGRKKSEAERKTLKEKMLKKTRFGQPVMKYRIEHLLETIQSSKS